MGISNTRIVGFITAFLLLVLSYILLFLNSNKLSEQALVMDHTNKVITNLEYLASEYQGLETTFRGFMATRNTSLKERFYLSANRTDSLYRLVRQLVSDNSSQVRKMDTIRSMIDQKLSELRPVVDTASLIPPRVMIHDFLKSVGYTWLTPPVIAKYIKQMEYYENALLLERTHQLKNFNRLIRLINIVSLLLAVLLAAYSLNTYLQESRARKQADLKSDEYKREVENRIQQLADANKEIRELRMIEKFAATGRIARTIAHEVRNPLTNINLAAEQLKDELPVTADSTMLIDMIKRNGLRINQLISDLLSATKFSELKFVKVSLPELLQQSLEFAEDRISLKHVKVIKNFAADPCMVMMDEDKMKIAFLNIFVNAIEAMEPGEGVLNIRTEKLDHKCRVYISDNGPGMNEETLSRLFEPFFTSKEKGSGLGLTNTQNIILNHKGTIQVESMEGLGTTFIVTLDLV